MNVVPVVYTITFSRQARLTIAIVILFRRSLTMLDLAFIATVLMIDVEIIKKMRNLPLIVMGIAVPALVSPVMFSLWTIRGTGNANYFFFQGLCLWLFSAFFIVEFIIAYRARIEQYEQADK